MKYLKISMNYNISKFFVEQGMGKFIDEYFHLNIVQYLLCAFLISFGIPTLSNIGKRIKESFSQYKIRRDLAKKEQFFLWMEEYQTFKK